MSDVFGEELLSQMVENARRADADDPKTQSDSFLQALWLTFPERRGTLDADLERDLDE